MMIKVLSFTSKNQFPRFFYFFFLFFFLIQDQAYCTKNLLFSVDIVRHGDRNPVIEIPKSPYPWKGELGGLTDAGIQREKKLGSELRKEYVNQFNLLPPKFRSGVLYVRSTDFSRTKNSAKALLEGLYPLSERTAKPDGTEIPIEIVKKNQEELLLVEPSSSPLALIKMFFWKRNFWKEHTQDIQDDLQQWREATGLKLNTMDEVVHLADHLYIRQLNHIQIPKGMSQTSADKMVSLSELAMISFFEQKEVSGPSGTKLISNLKTYFDQRIHGGSELRYVLYLAHDSTIMATLRALGAKVRYPNYASRLNFRLLNGVEGYHMEVYQDGKRVDISLCKTGICEYSEFFSNISKVR